MSWVPRFRYSPLVQAVPGDAGLLGARPGDGAVVSRAAGGTSSYLRSAARTHFHRRRNMAPYTDRRGYPSRQHRGRLLVPLCRSTLLLHFRHDLFPWRFADRNRQSLLSVRVKRGVDIVRAGMVLLIAGP